MIWTWFSFPGSGCKADTSKEDVFYSLWLCGSLQFINDIKNLLPRALLSYMSTYEFLKTLEKCSGTCVCFLRLTGGWSEISGQRCVHIVCVNRWKDKNSDLVHCQPLPGYAYSVTKSY